MTAAMAMPGNTAETFLVHFFGTGLADDRYVVERFRARADGDIVPTPAEAPKAKGGRTTTRTTATLKAVREMKPACTEIIICTGLRTRGGWQLWGVDRGRPSLRPQAEGLTAPFPDVLPARRRRGVLPSISGLAGRRPSWLTATSTPGAETILRAFTAVTKHAARPGCA